MDNWTVGMYLGNWKIAKVNGKSLILTWCEWDYDFPYTGKSSLFERDSMREPIKTARDGTTEFVGLLGGCYYIPADQSSEGPRP